MRIAKTIALVGVAALAAYVGTTRIIVFRRDQATKACVENLQRIDGAKQQWALEYLATQDAEPTWFDIFFYGGRVRNSEDWPVHCPSGGYYVLGRVGDPPQCSIAHHAAAFHGELPRPIAQNDRREPLAVTTAYRKELVRLMIAEAKSITGQLSGNLKLDPILATNVTIWPPILSVVFSGPVAGIRVGPYEYTLTVKDFGIVASGIGRAGWREPRPETNQWDSNKVVQVARELLTSAGIDVGALDRDCDVSLDPWFRKFHRIRDPVHTVAWRQRQDTFFFHARHVSAEITFRVPAKLIGDFAVHDSRYILRKPLETLNMVKLLTPENSREDVLNAVETATNYVKRIRQLQEGGAQKMILQKVWFDYTTVPFPTNIFTGSNSL